jgi:hypothetical protein
VTNRPGDQHVWTLRKNENEATAIMREVPDYGREARLLFRGDLRQSRMFRDVQECIAWVGEWREELEGKGWVIQTAQP